MLLRIRNYYFEWASWWAALKVYQKVGPITAAILYWLIIDRVGTLSADHFLPVVAILGLYYAGPSARPLFEFALPLILMIVIYDSQRYYADYIRGPIHVREPYDFDKKVFGITEGGKIYTPSEWFQLHTYWLLDLITGFFYIAFVPLFLIITAYFRFRLSQTGTSHRSAEYIYARSPQIMWAFFWLNMIGFSTYYWYAASPPWYAEKYGFGPAIVHVPASPAGCSRFDQLLGLNVFDEWYGRAADVHGAIPSLHIAYPLLSVYYAFKFGALRLIALQFYLWLCFSAVYLNQHYVLDVIIGSIYALVTASVIDWIWERKLSRGKNRNVAP